MTKYKVTPELKEPNWIKRLLRWVGIMKPREEFFFSIDYDQYQVGEFLNMGNALQYKIIGKEVCKQR